MEDSAPTENYAPRTGLYLIFGAWAFTLLCRPQDYLTAVEAVRPALSLGVATLLLVIVSPNKIPYQKANPQITLYLSLLGVLLLSALFSIYTSASLYDYVHYLFTGTFVFVFYRVITTVETLKKTLFTLCSGITMYNLCVLTAGTSIKNRIAFGSMFDPNDIAFYVISFLTFNLLFIRGSKLRAILCFAYIMIGIVTILKTGSRGGLIALSAVVVYTVLFKGKTLIRSIPGKVFLLTLMLFAFQLTEINSERFKSITKIESDYNATDEQGRVAIWKVGIRLMAANPLTGVGFNRFPEGVGRDRVQRDLDQARWQTAHNSLIQVGAEAGIVAFLLFLVLSINALRIFRRTATSRSDDLARIGEMTEAGFLGHLVSAMFLSQAYSAYWAFYVALSAVLLRFMDLENAKPSAVASVDAAAERQNVG